MGLALAELSLLDFLEDGFGELRSEASNALISCKISVLVHQHLRLESNSLKRLFVIFVKIFFLM